MAQPDGKIRIETMIDNTAAEEDFKELLDLARQVGSEVGEDISQSVEKVAVEYNKLVAQQNEVNSKAEKQKNILDDLIAKQKELSSTGTKSDINQATAMQGDIDVAAAKFETLSARSDQLTVKLLHAKDTASKLATEIGKTAEETNKTTDGTTKTNSKLNETVRRAKELAKKFAVDVVKSLSSVLNGLKKIGTKLLYITGISKRFGNNDMSSGINRGIKSLAKYALALFSIRSIYSMLSRAANNWLNSDNIAAQQMKSNIDYLWSSVSNALAPALEFIVSLLYKLLSLVNSVLMTFFGINLFAEGLASSTSSSASNLSDASKAAKELKRQMAGFDEMNTLNFNKDTDSNSGSGGGGSGAVAPNFEPVVFEGLEGFLNKIKDLIKAEDWKGLGKLFGELFNEQVQRISDFIDWDRIGPKITKVVTAFTTFFNSLVDTIDWTNLGRAIGKGINTLVNTLNLLITGIDWKNLGKSFADGINGILHEVNWYNLGSLIGNKMMILPNILIGFVNRLDWTKVGLSLADGLNGIVDAINLAEIGSALGTAISGIAESLYQFATNFDWKKLATDFSTGINNAIKNIDMKLVAKSLSETAKGIFDALITAIRNIDWQQLGAKIVEFIANIDWIGLKLKLIELVAVILKAVVDTIIGFFGQMFTEAIRIMGEMFENIKSFFGTLPGWLYNNVIKPIGDFFGDLWTDVKQFAEDCWNGIVETWNVVSGWFNDNVIKPVKEFFSGMWNNVKQFAIDAWNGIKNTWNGVKTWFNDNIIQPVKNLFSGMWDNVKNFASNAWTRIKDIWKGVKTWFSDNVATPIKNVFTNLWNGIKDFISQRWNDILNLFSKGGKIFDGVVGSIGDVFKTIVNAIIDGINNVLAWPFEKISSALSFIHNIDLGWPIGKPFTIVPNGIWIPQIPRLAKGGIINRPTQAIIGEAGKEAVLPLQNNTDWMDALADKVAAQIDNDGDIIIDVNIDGDKLMRIIRKKEKESKLLTNGGIV